MKYTHSDEGLGWRQEAVALFLSRCHFAYAAVHQ